MLRERSAYVLLGEPGSGKTTAFREEARAAGCELVSARDFIALDRPEWRRWTLFIDGLDEIRAGSTDNRTPFDAIRRKIDGLGRPPFRISCREADWLGAGDRDALEKVAPEGRVTVLHLDNLDVGQIERLLRENHGVSDTNAFIENARKRRLEGLLGNPQNLNMLAEAARDGWRDSLAETYAFACQRLAEEPNRDHRDAWRQTSVPTDEVLNAAGYVCALQLLAGIAGVTANPDAADADHPDLGTIGVARTSALHRALASRLFQSHAHEERREPAHRSIAEYLGARFLARRIEREGLPPGRVLALMSAEDAGIVADLRGLHAWLAALCPSVRHALIENDPLGIVLYGDIRGFGMADQRHLLTALAREAARYPWFRSQDWSAPPFGALASADMRDDFRDILLDPARDEAHESLVDCVLEAIAHGEPLPQLDGPLLDVVRDGGRWSVNRKNAVRAYIQTASDRPAALLDLLKDIDTGLVEDGDDEITGLLLRHLYPELLPASEVINYLHPAKSPNLIGTYFWFWKHELVKQTRADDFPILLDAVAANIPRLHQVPDDFHLNEILGELLAHGLDGAGNRISTERLWNWLGIVLGKRGFSRMDKEHKETFAAWFARNPERYRALLDHGLRLCEGAEDIRHCLYKVDQRFHGADLPPDIEEWCLAKAALSDQTLRDHLFNKVAFTLLRRLEYTPALLDALLAIRDRYPGLESNVDAWLRSDPEDWRREDALERLQRQENEATRIAEWVALFRKHYNGIETGTASPGQMHDLSMIYFGRYREAEGDNPIDRFQSFFGNDAGITLAALAGLRRTLLRDDLPSVTEIVDLHIKGRHHLIAEACLAGAEELARSDAEAVLGLPRQVQERLIAFRLTHDFDNTPDWFLSLVAHRPETFAGVLISYGGSVFKARKERAAGIYQLAHDLTYADVARGAAIPLLAAYPLRWKRESQDELGSLLVAAIKHADRDALQQLIATKLSHKQLDAAQRSQWLAAGLLLDPSLYELPLARYVASNQSRAFLVAGFFGSRADRNTGLPELGESAMSLLIRLLAPHASPQRPQGAHWVSPAMNVADFVRSLISQLGAKPTVSATQAFENLLANDMLGAWRGELRHHRENQRIVSREAHFRRASVADVVRTLANAEPANAADLQALLVQHLRDIAKDDRDGSTTGYRRYWNVDSYGRPEVPRPEIDCRNRLLEILKERLRPFGLDAQAEGQYRENMRADIRVFFGGKAGGFNVPIEIKRNRHPDLWSALHKQLIAHYIRDPGAAGYGVYVVFWFGGTSMATAADGGKPPRSARELEDRLANTLGADERQRICVIVMDCSLP